MLSSRQLDIVFGARREERGGEFFTTSELGLGAGATTQQIQQARALAQEELIQSLDLPEIFDEERTTVGSAITNRTEQEQEQISRFERDVERERNQLQEQLFEFEGGGRLPSRARRLTANRRDFETRLEDQISAARDRLGFNDVVTEGQAQRVEGQRERFLQSLSQQDEQIDVLLSGERFRGISSRVGRGRTTTATRARLLRL